MKLLSKHNEEFEAFTGGVDEIIKNISNHAKDEDINGLKKLIENFNVKTEDFYRENRKLNIGVVGQVKAGKSSFLNTLLFDGKEILPKAATPKTATLTKMEYAETNKVHIEYYSVEEWKVLEDNSRVNLDDEIYTSAREIVDMIRKNDVDPYPYLKKGAEDIEFGSYEELVENLNDYVGEDGKYTAIVKAVILYINREEFNGISIVDTPGLNDPIASRTIRTKEFMELCDVVFFLSQTGSFLDKSDWILLSSQLPQKGVKKLVLVASKFDSGIRDVLRVQDDDDIFGDDDNTTDNIPKACKIIKKKLKKRARSKVDEYVTDLQSRNCSPELVEVIKQCSEPIMISSIANNMIGKNIVDFSPEELNVYSALKQFSDDIENDLAVIGNFDEVKNIFDSVVDEKEKILEQKSKSFVPNAKEELTGLLSSYLEKTNRRLKVLEDHDREQLEEQKRTVESKMSSIKAEIAAVFGELNVKLELEKAAGIRELRNASKDYLNVRERSGSKAHHESYYVSDAKWYNPFSWGTGHTEYYTYQEHYSYCIAADAIDNLRKYSIDSCNQIEEVFCEAIQLKELKRKLLNVVIDNFDMSDEKYDYSLFKIMLEETVSTISFPVFDMDISNVMNGIAGRFTGELTSASDKTELATALSAAISRIYNELCDKLDKTVMKFKNDMSDVGKHVEESLLTNIMGEFESLLSQFENKENEIKGYREYAMILQTELANI